MIALHTQREWPPRSPDLTPCDFLWGYLKDKVFVSPPQSLEELHNRIEQEFSELRTKPNFIIASVREMRRQVADCVDANGGC